MPDDFRTELIGAKELEGLLSRMSNVEYLYRAMKSIALRVQAAMKAYPPPPPDSTYRRTGTLGRKWTHRIDSSLFGISAIIGNNTPYAPLVQGEDTQAEVHAGRWQTDAEVLEASGDMVNEELGGAVDQMFRSG